MRTRTHARDLALLTLLCLATYFPGLTTHALTNWQEAQRAVVAREMQARGGMEGWLVPTINGRPYLAKPPLIYWCQLSLAEITGGRVGLLHLRLTVAIAGLLGVLATYLVARRLLDDEAPPPTHVHAHPLEWSRLAALWAALSLATGILYVRSSRIGELDILLVPFVVTGVGAIAAAWGTHRVHNRTNFPAVALAALCAVGAALTKGPPGLLALGLAAYGGIALHAAWGVACSSRSGLEHVHEDRSEGATTGRSGPVVLLHRLITAAAALGAFIIAIRHAVPGDSLPTVLIGAALIAAAVAGVTTLVVRLAHYPTARTLFTAYARTHPVAVLGAGALALWFWGYLVRLRVGPAAGQFMSEEAEDNLRLLVPQAPLNNLEAAAFGVGLGSVAAILALIWLIKDLPRPKPGWFIVFAWVGLGLGAFSLLGKGVGRYLTPLWPGIAILGGMFLASALIDTKRPRLVRGVLVVTVLVLAGVQSWWYGLGRERYDADRSPRALVAELLAPPIAAHPAGILTFEFRTPALDYELDRWVQPVGDMGMRPAMAGGESWSLDELREHLRSRGPGTLLVRMSEPTKREPALDRLRAAGFDIEPLATTAPFTIDAGKAPIAAVRVGVK